MTIPIQLAGINGINAENAIRGLIPSRSSVSEAVIFFGTLILVALFFFTAAVIFRPRHHRRHSQHHHSKPAPNMDFEDAHRKKTSPDSYHKHRRHSGFSGQSNTGGSRRPAAGSQQRSISVHGVRSNDSRLFLFELRQQPA